MPKLGMTLGDGTVVAWHVREGERVGKDQLLAEVETEKIISEVRSPQDGLVLRLVVPAGGLCAIGAPIALIGEAGESTAPDERRGLSPPVEPVPGREPPRRDRPGGSSRNQRGPSPGEVSSPAARRLARELGVDLTQVTGTGPGGRVTSDDVRRAAAHKPSEPPTAGRLVPLSPTRRAIAARLQASVRDVPQVTLFATADARGLVRARAEYGPKVEAPGVRLAYDDVLVAVVARALIEDGTLHASFEPDGIRYHDRAHIGVAVAVDDGVLVPVIPDADRLTLAEIAGRRSALADRARARRLEPADVQGGTFTITNLGMYPVDAFGAIINPPQAAILSVGRIRPEPVAVDGQVVVRDVVGLGLTFDHRVADGAAAARFLDLLIRRLENPAVA